MERMMQSGMKTACKAMSGFLLENHLLEVIDRYLMASKMLMAHQDGRYSSGYVSTQPIV